MCSKSILTPIILKAKGNHYYKKLKTYEHFIAMLYCVVTGSTSLREIEAGLGIAQGKLNHLGIEYVPPRSTLSDGNKNCSSNIFRAIYDGLYEKYKPNFSDSTKISKVILQKLYLMNSTVFSFFKEILKTSGRYSMDGKKKGVIKKNTILDSVSLMPSFISFTAAAQSDQKIYKDINLIQGSYIVFDKGYNNYQAFLKFTQQGVFLDTRQKQNAVYTTVIEAMFYENNQTQTLKLRRIAWYDEKKDRCYEFITNNFEIDATMIAQLYQYRWKIELFFKKLKQNFPLQYFVGDNQNAIEIQIWMALIASLLLSVIHQQQKTKMAFSVFVTIIKLHLFNYISIGGLLGKYNKKKTIATTQISMFDDEYPPA